MSRGLTRRALFALPVVTPLLAAAKPAFATGGVVGPMKMARFIGEAPEAILPLRRGANGKLGIIRIDAGGLGGRFTWRVHAKSCGGVESRHAGSATRVSAAAPTETSGTVTRVQVKGEAGVAPGPHDAVAQLVVA